MYIRTISYLEIQLFWIIQENASMIKHALGRIFTGFNGKTRNALFTGLSYAVYFVLALILENLSPSGPCTPGLGALLIMLWPFVIWLLLIIDIARFFRRKEVGISIMIHILMFLIFLILINKYSLI